MDMCVVVWAFGVFEVLLDMQYGKLNTVRLSWFHGKKNNKNKWNTQFIPSLCCNSISIFAELILWSRPRPSFSFLLTQWIKYVQKSDKMLEVLKLILVSYRNPTIKRNSYKTGFIKLGTLFSEFRLIVLQWLAQFYNASISR